MKEVDGKKVLKTVERVSISNLKGDKTEVILARVDTGASKSSVGLGLAAKLELGPIKGYTNIKNAHGVTTRAVVEAVINIDGEKIREKFTIGDRQDMKYKALIGRNVLRRGFLVDASEEEE